MKLISLTFMVVATLVALAVAGCTITTGPPPANGTSPPTTTPPSAAPGATTPPAQPVATTPPAPSTTATSIGQGNPPPKTSRIRRRFQIKLVDTSTVTEANAFGGPKKTDTSFEGLVYLVDRQTTVLPNLSNLRPIARLYTESLNIASQDFRSGFRPMSDRFEFFVIQYQGTFSVTTPGPHEFKLVSDDGARVSVDNVPLINNDGIHAATAKTETVNLAPGNHRIVIEYWQAQGNVALQLFVTTPGGQQQPFSAKL